MFLGVTKRMQPALQVCLSLRTDVPPALTISLHFPARGTTRARRDSYVVDAESEIFSVGYFAYLIAHKFKVRNE